ncbi:hypothetical protein LTR10_016194 [Elasticomyces elasticus]|uniref:Uncharacterized protein n=1 Tax=Exophiala sideris TaxID=1016849 RepID=A0ABR0JP12_9EURO|nr:hypothetical protein LTR10_016194 [Elasticomyces elasticus]KAK5037974.1 hypothetical protein LTS07_001441 [Exophiala sideris]KAK5043956.1 hypothetical protein LTR13_000311 [Exophiala sideris]KAK5067455.1 hypothetical protein LTR69_001443 [Exophiala sideris]KAK5182788.1 hypothetical protein LTR44_005179 [Eurotiomycetes sp. CCFEE 6388]
MSLVNTLVLLAAAAPAVLSTAITTITPCPANPTLAAPITVTEQYETVSTCGVSVSCNKWKSCTTTYPFTTSVFVSTTIPCSWDGTSAESTIVTKTDQVVTGSVTATTLSTVSAVETFAWGAKWGWNSESTSYTTQYETRVKEWDAAYETMGPIAVPGWGGSGLCTDCEEGDVKIQTWNVTDCHNGNMGGSSYSECVRYEETWIAYPNVEHSAPATAHCQSQFTAPSAGTYYITFPQSAPPATVTVPAHGGQAERVTVVPGQSWDAVVTRSCRAPTIIEIDIYITKVLIYIVPDWAQSTASSSSIPFTPIWEQWTSSTSASSSGASSTSVSSTASIGPISMTTSSSSSSSTSSSSMMSSSSSSSTSAMTTSMTSTSTATTTTGTPTATIMPEGLTFALEVTFDGASAKHKRQAVDNSSLVYLNFQDGNNAELSSFAQAARCVTDDDAHILTGGLYIGADGVDESDPALLEASVSLPTFNFWMRYIDSDVVFILNRIFCLVNENQVSVLPEGTFCAELITLRTYPAPPTTSSTSSTSMISTTSMSANATTTSAITNSTTSMSAMSTTSSFMNSTTSSAMLSSTTTSSFMNSTTSSAMLSSTTSFANTTSSTTSMNGTTTSMTTTTSAAVATVIAPGQTLQAVANVPLAKHKRAVNALLYLSFDDNNVGQLGSEADAATLVSNDAGELVFAGDLFVGASPPSEGDAAFLQATVGEPSTNIWLLDSSNILSLFERLFCLLEDLTVETVGPDGDCGTGTRFNFMAHFIHNATTTSSMTTASATTTSFANSTTSTVLATTTSGLLNTTSLLPTSLLPTTTGLLNTTTTSFVSTTTSFANSTTSSMTTTSASNSTTTTTTSATSTATVVAAGQALGPVSVTVPSGTKAKRDTVYYLGINDQNIAQLGSEDEAATLVTGTDGHILYGVEYLGANPTSDDAAAYLEVFTAVPIDSVWLMDSAGGIFLQGRQFCVLTDLTIETVDAAGDNCDGTIVTFHASSTPITTTSSMTSTTSVNGTSTTATLPITTPSVNTTSILPASATTTGTASSTSTSSMTTTSTSTGTTSTATSSSSSATTTVTVTTTKTTTSAAGPTASGGSMRRRAVPSNPMCAAFGSTCSLGSAGVQGSCCNGYFCSAESAGAQGDCAMCVSIASVCESDEQCCSGNCVKDDFLGLFSLNKRGICA